MVLNARPAPPTCPGLPPWPKIESVTSSRVDLTKFAWLSIAAALATNLLIPAGTRHDFANRSNRRMGLFNVFIPGGFEKDMPAVVKRYEENPPG